MKHTWQSRLHRFMASVLFAGFCTVSSEKARAVVSFQPVHLFFGMTGANLDDEMTQPNPALIQASDGCLYGTVAVGGMYGFGFIFRLTTNGALTMVYSFSGGSEGGTPEAALTQVGDHNLYGTTADGGANYHGTVFRITTSGAFTTLYSFTGGADGAAPETTLVPASDGSLYGAASWGGASDAGTLFRITTNGALTPLYSNSGLDDIGGAPSTSLMLTRDGTIFGSIFTPPYNPGSIFQISTNGAYTTVYSFAGVDGTNPNGLVQATNGSLYGTTETGGASGGGVVFSLTTNGVFTTIYAFPSGVAASYPGAPPTEISDGTLYGTTSGVFGGGTIFRITTDDAQTELYALSGSTDGAYASGLVQASDGFLYGSTDSGGMGNRGTLFRFATNGAPGDFMVIDSFPSANTGEYPDGAFPRAGITQVREGNLYGSTTYGGLDNSGAIFRLGTNGAFTVVYSFTNGSDASGPSPLVQASDSNLYGTTSAGGAHGKGTIFRITTNGVLTSLYAFLGLIDGASPSGGLVQADDGNLYGTASAGGINNSGTIFKLTTNSAFTRVYTFTNGYDGADPVGLAPASGGNLYGVTSSGGAGSNGTLFEVNLDGIFEVIHSFTGGNDGAEPSGASLLATNGYLYGTTLYGGSAPGKAGTVFQLASSGTFATLYSFTGGIDGNNPTGLAKGSDGNLYGATQSGGAFYSGTIFQISTNGVFSVIHNFTGGSDGSWPLGSLVSASDGYIYGTTSSGGGVLGGYGTLFRVVITFSNAPLPALQFPLLSAGNLTFGFEAAAGQSYFLQQSTNLATTNWTYYTNLVGAGSAVQLAIPATKNAQFFRISEP